MYIHTCLESSHLKLCKTGCFKCDQNYQNYAANTTTLTRSRYITPPKTLYAVFLLSLVPSPWLLSVHVCTYLVVSRKYCSFPIVHCLWVSQFSAPYSVKIPGVGRSEPDVDIPLRDEHPAASSSLFIDQM